MRFNALYLVGQAIIRRMLLTDSGSVLMSTDIESYVCVQEFTKAFNHVMCFYDLLTYLLAVG